MIPFRTCLPCLIRTPPSRPILLRECSNVQTVTPRTTHASTSTHRQLSSTLSSREEKLSLVMWAPHVPTNRRISIPPECQAHLLNLNSCCGVNKKCGYGPDYCGENNCTSNCDALAMCGRYSDGGNIKCGMNLCCSYYGWCGVCP